MSCRHGGSRHVAARPRCRAAGWRWTHRDPGSERPPPVRSGRPDRCREKRTAKAPRKASPTGCHRPKTSVKQHTRCRARRLFQASPLTRSAAAALPAAPRFYGSAAHSGRVWRRTRPGVGRRPRVAHCPTAPAAWQCCRDCWANPPATRWGAAASHSRSSTIRSGQCWRARARPASAGAGRENSQSAAFEDRPEHFPRFLRGVDDQHAAMGNQARTSMYVLSNRTASCRTRS